MYLILPLYISNYVSTRNTLAQEAQLPYLAHIPVFPCAKEALIAALAFHDVQSTSCTA